MSGFFNYQTPDVGPRIDPLLERVGRQFVIYGANAGVNITLSPVSFLSVSLGAQVFAPRFGSNSITPSTAITYTRQFSYFSFSANYVNGFQSNFTAIDNTGVSQTRAASVSLATSVLRNLTAGLTGIYAENEFKQTTLVGGRAGQVERTWAANANLNYAILQWLSLYLGYTFNIRTSDSPGGEWYQNTVVPKHHPIRPHRHFPPPLAHQGTPRSFLQRTLLPLDPLSFHTFYSKKSHRQDRKVRKDSPTLIKPGWHPDQNLSGRSPDLLRASPLNTEGSFNLRSTTVCKYCVVTQPSRSPSNLPGPGRNAVAQEPLFLAVE